MMNNPFRGRRPATTVLVGLVAGALIAVLLWVSRESPQHGATIEAVHELRIIVAERVPFRFWAHGHGVSRAAETWQAVANVPGRVVERHPGLESGKLVRAGELLLALDDSRYRLAIAEAEAQMASLRAEQAGLDREQENSSRLLQLERESLELSEQELARMEQLVERGSVSRSQRDQQLRATVAQRQAVATLENQLTLMPSRRNRLQAELERAETRLGQAQEDLDDTRFIAPYDLRIDQVGVELHQQVVAGQMLLRGDSIEAAEIEAHLPLSALRRLMGSVLRAEPVQPIASGLDQRLDFAAIDAEVRLAGLDHTHWPARVVRVASGLDPVTRSARIVVLVDRPYDKVAPPRQPALQPGMFLQVSLSAAADQELLAIPAAALHQGEIYLAAEGDRLERRRVTLAFQQGDLAVIEDGLSPGERVIVDDPVPALGGMRLKPRRDRETEQWVRSRAAGGLR
jgi:RND family efflux transporter MFP subunit